MRPGHPILGQALDISPLNIVPLLGTEAKLQLIKHNKTVKESVFAWIWSLNAQRLTVAICQGPVKSGYPLSLQDLSRQKNQLMLPQKSSVSPVAAGCATSWEWTTSNDLREFRLYTYLLFT